MLREYHPIPWWNRFVCLMVATVMVCIGAALISGPDRWTTSDSLLAVRHYSHLSWDAWGVLFIAMGTALVNRRSRLVGYLAGGVTCTFFVLMAVLFSVILGNITNVVTIGVAILGCLLFFTCLRYEVERRELAR